MSTDTTRPDVRDLPAAVLWDMDGTLVDTEPYWIIAEHELVEEFGGTWTHDLALQLVGNPLLVSVYDSLAGVLESAITENVADLPGTYDDQHEALVAAIVARDPEAAANAARSFLHAIQEERS